MINVVACMKVDLRPEEHGLSPHKLADIIAFEEEDAKYVLDGSLELKWEEMLKIAAYLNIDISDLHFTPADNPAVRVAV